MNKFTKNLIAPCGMNCGVCQNFLRAGNKCPGCFRDRKVNNRPIKCRRRLCKKRTGEFCYDCNEFPCESIKKLDERYRKHYGMSMIENLKSIKKDGIMQFLTDQSNKYISKPGIYCVHDKLFYKGEK